MLINISTVSLTLPLCFFFHLAFKIPPLKGLGEFRSFEHELPILLAVNTVLCFNKAQRWYIFSACKWADPRLVWHHLDEESFELDLKTRAGM